MAWRDWLATHAAHETELLVGFHKVGSGQASMSWPQSVDEALCVGWIDGVRRRVDESRYSMRFTPRQSGSHWSAVNIARVAVLTAEGRMQPAGLAAFALRTAARSARAAYEQAESAALARAETRRFKAEPAAWDFFSRQPPGYRQRMLWWVVSAKQALTRARRLDRLIAASAACTRI